MLGFHSETGWRSSMAEQRFCKPLVGGSIPLASSIFLPLPIETSLVHQFFHPHFFVAPHPSPLPPWGEGEDRAMRWRGTKDKGKDPGSSITNVEDDRRKDRDNRSDRLFMPSRPFYDESVTVISMRSRGLSRPSRLAATTRSTRSRPLTTSPNAVYWPSRNGESATQIKNCDPALSGS